MVGNAIKATTPKNMTVYRQVMTAVGMAIVEGIAANAASDYVMNAFNTLEKAKAIADVARKMKKEVDKDGIPTTDSD